MLSKIIIFSEKYEKMYNFETRIRWNKQQQQKEKHSEKKKVILTTKIWVAEMKMERRTKKTDKGTRETRLEGAASEQWEVQ